MENADPRESAFGVVFDVSITVADLKSLNAIPFSCPHHTLDHR